MLSCARLAVAVGQVVEIVFTRVVAICPKIFSGRPVHDVNFSATALPGNIVSVNVILDVRDCIRFLPRRPARTIITQRDDIAVAVLPSFSYCPICHFILLKSELQSPYNLNNICVCVTEKGRYLPTVKLKSYYKHSGNESRAPECATSCMHGAGERQKVPRCVNEAGQFGVTPDVS